MSTAAQVSCDRILGMMQHCAIAASTWRRQSAVPSLVSSVASLGSHTTSLTAALDKLSATDLMSPGLAQTHVRFLSDFYELFMEVIPAMVRLEEHASTTTTTTTSSSSGGESLQSTAFGQLWDLLIASSSVFAMWPPLWPTGHSVTHAPLLTTLDELLSLLLRITRRQTDPWPEWNALGPLDRQTRAHILLRVPLLVLVNLTTNPPPQHEVLSILPVMSIEKLCCLSCEQLSGPPSTDPGQQVCKGTAAAAHMAAGRDREINLRHTEPEELVHRASGYSWFFSVLASASSDAMRHSTQPQSALRRSTSLHPAVVLVLKAALALHTSWEGMGPEQLAHTHAAVLRLDVSSYMTDVP
ncbi:MAG: hypothetical protein WDW36_006324 [Sanguina aurantia]